MSKLINRIYELYINDFRDIGSTVALSFPKYDQALLIIGISLLMIGIYRISRNLSSKNEEDFQDPATKIRNPEDN